MIPVSSPVAAPNAKKYLLACAISGWFSSHGPFVERFENACARWLGVSYAATVTSGTAALHVALAATGIGPGDEVIVPTFTMFSPVAAILYVGATPVFVDSDPMTWTMDVHQVKTAITPKTRAIIAVSIYGHPVDMDPLIRLAKNHHLILIEDAAEGLGALYKGKKVGTLGDMACFSFYANKVVTTGEGGMVTTNNPTLAKRIKAFADMCHDPKKRFRHTDLGFTYRMTNMQAAVGLSYLEQIDKTIAKKRWVANLYNMLLSDLPYLTLHKEQPHAHHVLWMYGVLVAPTSPISRDKLREKLLRRGIDTREFFLPAHVQPVIRKSGMKVKGHFPVAEDLAKRGLYLPSGPHISERDIRTVCRTIKDIYATV